MDAFFKDREATIDKKNRLRAEMQAAAVAAGPRQMDPWQQQREQQQYEYEQQQLRRQGVALPQRLQPHPPEQTSGDDGRLARHEAKQRRHRERAAQWRQEPVGGGMQHDAASQELTLREALEAERNARRMLEEQLAMYEQRSAQGWNLTQHQSSVPQREQVPRPQPQARWQPEPPSAIQGRNGNYTVAVAAQSQPNWHPERPKVVKGGNGGNPPAAGAYISRSQYEIDLQQQIQEKRRRKAEAAAKEAEEDRRAEEIFNRQQAEIKAALAVESAQQAQEEARREAARVVALQNQQAQAEAQQAGTRTVAAGRRKEQNLSPHRSLDAHSPRTSHATRVFARSTSGDSPRLSQRLMQHRYAFCSSCINFATSHLAAVDLSALIVPGAG